VLMAIEPPLLRDSTRELLSSDPEIELVEDIDTGVALVEEARRAPVDLVVMGLRDREFPDEVGELLSESPATKVLGIGSEGRRAFSYEMRPQVIPIGELDGERLVELVKEAARSRRGRPA
jgi:DNA-binding NarL/FixJ family response regulator